MQGDVEVLELCASVVRGLGLSDAVIDVGHASIARALLEPLPPPLAAEVTDALGQKDGARVERLLAGRPFGRVLAALSDLHGGGPGDASGEALLDRAVPLLAGTGAEGPLSELRALWTLATSATSGRELARMLRLDLGEVRGFAYYTGVIFHVLAPGPGEPVGAGGRYDDLLARFDAPMPAVGFALNLDSIVWAREAAGVGDERRPRAVVASETGAPAEAARRAVAALREQGIAAVLHPAEGAAAHAIAWRFTHLVTVRDTPPWFDVRRLDGERAPGHDAAPSRAVDDPAALARTLRDSWP
jgi:ATP phosphoribosyltransferase regulatory subunit